MSKIFVSLIIVLLGLGLTGYPVVAQGSNYDTLLKAYREAYDEYKVAYDKYIVARAEYVKFQTLVSKTVATDTTQEFLTARQNVLITYLTMMKERLEQSTELTEEEIGLLIKYINDEVELLESEIPLFDTADDLEDLVKVSQQIEKRSPTIEANAFRIKGFVITSKVRSARKVMANLLTIATEQVARIRKENLTDSSRMDRWLIEAGERVQFADTNELAALDKFAKLKDKDTTTSKTKLYNQLQTDLKVAAQYLREANNFLLEIVQDIRFD